METLWMVAASPAMQVVGVLWLAGLLVALVGSLWDRRHR